MNLIIRNEKAQEQHTVNCLIREAFWGYTHPTCDEHYLAHLLRGDPAFVPELNLVAERDGKLIGSVLYSKARVVDADCHEHEVLTFGPLSVLPEYHLRHGVGSALMRHSIREAANLGYRAIVFYGHPDYYPRFGFQCGAAYGIVSSQGKSFDALMAMPLYQGGLDGISGRFYEPAPFHLLDEEKAAAFDRLFPPKTPASMTPIEALLSSLPLEARPAFEEREIRSLQELYRYSGREMLRWPGIGLPELEQINGILRAHGLALKLPPSSPVFSAAPQ